MANSRYEARNELLPGLYGQGGDDIEFDVMLDRDTAGLRVVGYNKVTKKSARFFISAEQIKSGAYKAAFNPGVQRLKAELSG